MKLIAILLATLSLQAEIVKEDDGRCYEKKGRMLYITPCPNTSVNTTPQTQNGQTDKPQSVQVPKSEFFCRFTLGEYQLEYPKNTQNSTNTMECDALLSEIKKMNLVYEQSLITNKKKIADIFVKDRDSLCKIGIYVGDFITVGLMRGDQFTCNRFMEYHAIIQK